MVLYLESRRAHIRGTTYLDQKPYLSSSHPTSAKCSIGVSEYAECGLVFFDGQPATRPQQVLQVTHRVECCPQTSGVSQKR
jgi:hypothetical protein